LFEPGTNGRLRSNNLALRKSSNTLKSLPPLNLKRVGLSSRVALLASNEGPALLWSLMTPFGILLHIAEGIRSQDSLFGLTIFSPLAFQEAYALREAVFD
jgi:hypothetical protein